MVLELKCSTGLKKANAQRRLGLVIRHGNEDLRKWNVVDECVCVCVTLIRTEL